MSPDESAGTTSTGNHQQAIAVVGLWHLGSITVAGILELGNDVIAYDRDTSLRTQIGAGREPVSEPGVAQVLSDALANGRLTVSDDTRSLAESKVVCFAYDTPVNTNDMPDMAWLESRFSEIVPNLRDDVVLIVSSQMPIGTCRKWRDLLRAQAPQAELVYMPENLQLGSALSGFLTPRTMILGAESSTAANTALELFHSVVEQAHTVSLPSAELTKHAINSYLALSIVFGNSLADIAESNGASMSDVLAGLRTDRRVSPNAPMAAGLPFSGGTLARDLRILEGSSPGVENSLFTKILELNSERMDLIIRTVRRITNSSSAKYKCTRIAVWGITYKPETSSLRRSLPLEIVNTLTELEFSVAVHDPGADFSELEDDLKFEIVDSPIDACNGADLLLPLTGWKQYAAPDWEHLAKTMRTNSVFDPITIWKSSPPPNTHFEYRTVGEG